MLTGTEAHCVGQGTPTNLSNQGLLTLRHTHTHLRTFSESGNTPSLAEERGQCLPVCDTILPMYQHRYCDETARLQGMRAVGCLCVCTATATPQIATRTDMDSCCSVRGAPPFLCEIGLCLSNFVFWRERQKGDRDPCCQFADAVRSKLEQTSRCPSTTSPLR